MGLNKIPTISESDRILIIGGTGFIGRHLAQKCLHYSSFVTSLGLTNSIGKEANVKEVEYIQADILDREKLKSALNGRSYDYVFNLGGYIDHTPYFMGGHKVLDAHFIGVTNIINCLDRKKLKGFVQVGSSDEYGSQLAPQNETMRERPFSTYSFSKTASTHFVQMLHLSEGFPGVVIRLFLTYGPGQDEKRFLPQIVIACLKDESFETTEGRQLRDFCYVDDVVDGLIKSAVTPQAKGHIFNIASGKPVRIRDMIDEIVGIIGKGSPILGARLYREGEHMELFADINLAKDLLRWKPRITQKDGLTRTIDYYKGVVG
jgi:nucleoside-diphosphate-sugar epimerase